MSKLSQIGFRNLIFVIVGRVFVDGQEMVTRLPAVKDGSCVTLLSEVIKDGKVRVTIETQDKVVTADWRIEPEAFSIPGLLEVTPEKSLYFAMSFSQSGWRVQVE